jgi:hypothetical protein
MMMIVKGKKRKRRRRKRKKRMNNLVRIQIWMHLIRKMIFNQIRLRIHFQMELK